MAETEHINSISRNMSFREEISMNKDIFNYLISKNEGSVFTCYLPAIRSFFIDMWPMAFYILFVLVKFKFYNRAHYALGWKMTCFIPVSLIIFRLIAASLCSFLLIEK